jgi:hypothetical protein
MIRQLKSLGTPVLKRRNVGSEPHITHVHLRAIFIAGSQHVLV